MRVGVLTSELVAMYMREGENLERMGLGTLEQKVGFAYIDSVSRGAHVDIHFSDQVGKSFSKVRV